MTDPMEHDPMEPDSMEQPTDPYRTLGVSRSATETELRAAYRTLAQRHHPDHNGGSPESARRFAEIQDAYARVRTLRATTVAAGAGASVEERLAEMERELRVERERRAAAAAAGAERDRRATAERRRATAGAAGRQAGAGDAASGSERASDEELGYVRTDDSLTKILDDWLDGKA